MPSTASTTLRLEKMANGENTGTWGTKANLNLDMIEAAVAGTTSISTTGGTTTLSNVDYTNDQAKKALLYVTGTLVSNATIVIPNASKTYKVFNQTSGAFTLSVKTASGTAKTVTQATSVELYCDGSNTILYMTPMTVPTTGAPATASGAAASAVAVTPTGNLGSTDAQAALAELQGDIDTINAALPNKQPLDSDLTTLAGLSTAKGNTIVGNGSIWTALTVGSDGLVLRAASAQSSGAQWAAGAPSGTISTFQQTAAPTGWTKNTTHDNKAFRIVSGTASTGGSAAFTTAFAARTIAQANLPNIAPTITITDPGHTHPYGFNNPLNAGSGGAGSIAAPGTDFTTGSSTTGITATASSINGNVTQTTMDFAVAYVDMILATAT